MRDLNYKNQLSSDHELKQQKLKEFFRKSQLDRRANAVNAKLTWQETNRKCKLEELDKYYMMKEKQD